MFKCVVVTVVGAVAIAGAVVSGCSFNVNVGSKPSVSKEDLQKDISDRLTKAGEAPESVTCKDDLVGEVGQTTRCGVVLSPTNSFEPIIEVTGVDGTTVSYDMTPAVSKEQLAKQVGIVVEKNEGSPVDSVSCESGLTGEQGQIAYCDVDTRGSTLRRTVEVTKVEGLLMTIVVIPKYSKAEIEDSLLDLLAQRLDERPGSADCSEDLEGKTGTSIECLVVAGTETETFTVTVTGTKGGTINYNAASKT